MMFRFSRPLLQQSSNRLRRATGLTGLSTHPDPIPALQETYSSTLSRLASLPKSSVYRQGAEALTRRKLSIVKGAEGNIDRVEELLGEGVIEQSLQIAKDELELSIKMADWKV